MNELLNDLKNAIVEGDTERASRIAGRCLAADMPAEEIFDTAIVPGIRETGVLWDCNRYRVPDVILSADAFNAAVGAIEQHLCPNDDDVRPKVVLGVVEGDVHDLGKSIVAAMLQGAGLRVIDLGVDVSAAGFVEAVRREQPEILGIGAYMSTTMLAIPEILEALERAGLRAGLRVLVGGVPTTQLAADRMGADGWAPDASAAVRKVRELLAGNPASGPATE